MSNTSEQFTAIYDFLRETLQNKTGFQSLKTEEILSLFNSSATLTVAYQLKEIQEVLQDFTNISQRNNF